MSRNVKKAVKDKLLSVKVPTDFYNDLQKIAEDLGGMSISSMVRLLLYSRVDKVKKSGNPKIFLDMDKK